MKQIVCKKELCSGCLACVVACLDEHYDEKDTDAVSGRIYEKHVSQRTGMQCYKTRSCLHCADAPCVKVCKTGALYQGESGYIRVDKEKCTGCHACERVCLHDVPRFDIKNRTAKCDGCAERMEKGLEPACVRICPTGALRIL